MATDKRAMYELMYVVNTILNDEQVKDVVERHALGQPILIGTASVEKSEVLSSMLKKANVPHKVLNAKHHESEASIVAEAGRKGAVTVSTNMAGRGTDIMLGGNPEFLADLQLRKNGLDPQETPEEYEAEWGSTLKALEEQVKAEHEEVVELGGLYVVGSERHESRRIDNQLRGRSGRQGDPGESRFYLSLSDDLMRLFRPELLERALLMMKVPDDVPIDMKSVSKSIEGAQKQVEGQNFEMRKNVLKYDDVMNRQRHAIYGDRRQVLDGVDVSEQLKAATERVVSDVVRQHTAGIPEDWDLDTMFQELKTLYPVSISIDEIADDLPEQHELVEMFLEDAENAYKSREETLGEDTMRELERQVLLTVLDRKWREHLYEMDYLREGIGLRAMAQRDPLVEYQREGGDMFNAMMEAFMEEVVGFLFNLEVKPQPTEPALNVGLVTDADGSAVGVDSLAESLPRKQDDAAPKQPQPAAKPKRKPSVQVPAEEPQQELPPALAKGLERKADRNLSYSAPDESGQETKTGAAPAQTAQKVGRNQPCPCGSGKKYKMCHGRPGGLA